MKIGTFAEELQTFSKGVGQAMPGLTLLCFMLAIYLIVFGAFFNMLEDQAHRDYPCGTVDKSLGCVPEGKVGFESIPHSIWFVLATLTTVGYGDVYPLTVPGKMVGMVCMMTGILVLALPIVLVGNAFQDVFEERQRAKDATEGLEAPAAVDNPLSNDDALGPAEWTFADERIREQHRSRKQVVISLLERLSEETQDPSYAECIELLSKVEARPAGVVQGG